MRNDPQILLSAIAVWQPFACSEKAICLWRGNCPILVSKPSDCSVKAVLLQPRSFLATVQGKLEVSL